MILNEKEKEKEKGTGMDGWMDGWMAVYFALEGIRFLDPAPRQWNLLGWFLMMYPFLRVGDCLLYKV